MDRTRQVGVSSKHMSLANRSRCLARACLAILLLLPGVARAASGAKPPAKKATASKKAPAKVAVMAVHTTGIPKGVGSTLTEVLTSEVASVSHLQVIGASDIKSLLGFQAQKQILGCSEDSSCLAQIGGALGVDLLVSAEVGRVGGTYVVSVKLIRIDEAKVEGRTYETVKGRIDAVIGRLRAAVHTVFTQAGLVTPAVASATRAGSASAGGWHVHAGSWVLWGAGAAALAAAAGFGLSAQGAYQKYQRAPDAYGAQQTVADGVQMQLMANIGFAVAAAGVAAGTVLFFVDHGGAAPADGPRAEVVPVASPDTVGAVATVHF